MSYTDPSGGIAGNNALAGIGNDLNTYVTILNKIQDQLKKVTDPNVTFEERKEAYDKLESDYQQMNNISSSNRDNKIMQNLKNLEDKALKDIPVYIPVPRGNDDDDDKPYDDPGAKDGTFVDKNGKTTKVTFIPLKKADGTQATAFDLLKNFNNDSVKYTASWKTHELPPDYGKNLGWTVDIHNHTCKHSTADVDDKTQAKGTNDKDKDQTIPVSADHHTPFCGTPHYDWTASPDSKEAAYCCHSEANSAYAGDDQALIDAENSALTS